VNADGTLAGVLTRKDIRDCKNQDGNAALQRTLSEVARTNTSNVYSDEPLRVVVYRMAETGFTRMPVVDRASGKFLGLISLDDLLKARARHLEEERRRERTLKLRFFLPSGRLAEEKDISANPKGLLRNKFYNAALTEVMPCGAAGMCSSSHRETYGASAGARASRCP
jgi:hypothetical protein